MEMCIDNPREGFADLFATHPSVDARVKALVKFAGGHDPGPIAAAGTGDRPTDRRRGVPNRRCHRPHARPRSLRRKAGRGTRSRQPTPLGRWGSLTAPWGRRCRSAM